MHSAGTGLQHTRRHKCFRHTPTLLLQQRWRGSSSSRSRCSQSSKISHRKASSPRYPPVFSYSSSSSSHRPQPEIKQIMRKRTAFETALVRRVAKKGDYLRYISYELNLEALRKKRVLRLSTPTIPAISLF